MTNLEAIEAMRQGHKVRHKFFTRAEFLYMKGRDCFCEQDHYFPFHSEQLKGVGDFANGWSIHNEQA